MLGQRIEGEHGWVVVNGTRYIKDIVIHVDGTVTERRVELSLPYRKEYFHTPLSETELGFLEEEKPEMVVVGAGFKGMMLVTPKARQILEKYESSVVQTQKAFELISDANKSYVAILHLTC